MLSEVKLIKKVVYCSFLDNIFWVTTSAVGSFFYAACLFLSSCELSLALCVCTLRESNSSCVYTYLANRADSDYLKRLWICFTIVFEEFQRMWLSKDGLKSASTKVWGKQRTLVLKWLTIKFVKFNAPKNWCKISLKISKNICFCFPKLILFKPWSFETLKRKKEEKTRKPKGCWTTFVSQTAPTVCSAS